MKYVFLIKSKMFKIMNAQFKAPLVAVHELFKFDIFLKMTKKCRIREHSYSATFLLIIL